MSEPVNPEELSGKIQSALAYLRYTNIGHNPAYEARGPILDILSRYNESALTECPHVASLDIPPGLSRGKRPEIVLWAAWKPDLLVCHDCRSLITLDDNTENHRCDGCGKIVMHITTGTSIIPAEVENMPPLVCVYGLCADCRKASKID